MRGPAETGREVLEARLHAAVQLGFPSTRNGGHLDVDGAAID